MADLKQTVDELVAGFTVQIQGIASRMAVSMLEASMPAAPARRKRHTREKRSPADLVKLANQLVQFVKVKPGRRIEQINAEIGTTTKELALPIQKLLASGVLVTKGRNRATAYFPGNT